MTENLTQVGTRPQQAWVIMHDQINRNVLHVASEAPFILKPAAEAGGFKELQEARHNAARDINAPEGTQRQRQVAAETSHDHAKQRQGTTAVNAAVRQRAFGDVFRLQIFRQTTVRFHNRPVQVHQPRS